MTGAVWHDGGTNPNSRFATLRAMVRHRTFCITRFRDWTTDAARTPDGELYSNKAPGPVLLAYPVAWALDRVGLDGRRNAGSSPPRLAFKTALSLSLQTIPFALVVWGADRVLARRGCSVAARRYAALAALFGNTAVLFMNTFFGHGVAAWCLLGMALALVEEHYAAAGLLGGLAALSDYMALLIAPLLLLAPLAGGPSAWRAVARVAVGGLLPAGLFAFYHGVCFGSPFVTALHYQRPRFADADHASPGLARVLSPLPDPEALRELSVGPSRGILFTQPWVYGVFAVSVALILMRRSRTPRPLLVVTLIGLPLLLWFNASFNGWHGGWTAGPRYLSPLFPVFALLGGLSYDALARPGRILLWAMLLPAIALRALIYAGDTFLSRGLQPLWQAYFDELRSDAWGAHGLRLALFLGGLAAAGAVAIAGGRARPGAEPAA